MRDAACPEQWAAMRRALLRIAYDETLSDLAGDPSLWPFTVAYLALGGRAVDGKLLDDKKLKAEWEALNG